MGVESNLGTNGLTTNVRCNDDVEPSGNRIVEFIHEVCGSVNSTEALTRHFVTYEPPDLIVSAPQKQVTADEATIIWKFVADSTAHVERFYWIADISNLERAPAGTPQRQQMRSLLKLAGLACVRGSFTQRTIMSVATRASRLLGYVHRDAQLGFFDDEAAARAWVDSLREKAKRSSET